MPSNSRPEHLQLPGAHQPHEEGTRLDERYRAGKVNTYMVFRIVDTLSIVGSSSDGRASRVASQSNSGPASCGAAAPTILRVATPLVVRGHRVLTGPFPIEFTITPTTVPRCRGYLHE